MTEEYVIDVPSLLSDSEALTEEPFNQFLSAVRSGARELEKCQVDLDQALKKNEKGLAADAGKAMKVAQLFHVLGRHDTAVAWFDKAGSGAQQLYLKGVSLREVKQYDQAIECFEKAEKKGHDSFAIAMMIVDCLRRGGNLDEARKKLKSASSGGAIRAEYHYQLGRLHDAEGSHEEAMNEYEQAIKLDEKHPEALFHLAFSCDLYGDEKEAIQLYQRSVDANPAHISALLNLAVLYEEASQFGIARVCVLRVLSAYPNHPRARLYLKDIDSSTTMYYDEEQEKRIDRRNQVLEIPISDFELSVRSRNCLRKMNIRTLHDLLRVTETELLAYKNFGETSLHEIKHILNQKNLRLGQLLEDPGSTLRRASLDEDEEEGGADDKDSLQNMSITELNLSIRARKALQKLNLDTLGSVIKCTEAELLGCKNFGQMSLTEIKEKLTEKGLALRTLDS
jgi:DNA-directed RNA polymerase subunit alpha